MNFVIPQLSGKVGIMETRSTVPIGNLRMKGYYSFATNNYLYNIIRVFCEPNLGYIILNIPLIYLKFTRIDPLIKGGKNDREK